MRYERLNTTWQMNWRRFFKRMADRTRHAKRAAYKRWAVYTVID